MKTGILTFHRCINYGSYWQARCLVEEIRRRGHDAVLLDHFSRRVNHAEWKCALQPVLPTPVPPADRNLYRRKIEKFFKAFDSLPLSSSIPLDSPSAWDKYDLIIIGSDEVWNLSHPWYGKSRVFYGEGINSGKLVSYAASFGNYSPGKLDKCYEDLLRQFRHISVRDENSHKIIMDTLNLEAAVVLDPTLQFPWVIRNITREKEYDYAGVYGHNFSQNFISSSLRWARERKIRLVSIGYRNDWADEQLINIGPDEFAAMMKNASAVITNFFHGCAFALINLLPFVCETSSYRSNKVKGLMKLLKGEKHLINDADRKNFNDCLDAPPDAEIFKRINQLRRLSEDFLQNALA